MEKTILVFSMFTYSEYKLGISNTNSHIYNWLKSENLNNRIIFVDFNRHGFINRLKYFIKYLILNKDNNVIKYGLFSKLIKIGSNNFIYKGISLNNLFNYLKKLEEPVEIWNFNPFLINYKVTVVKKYFYTVDDWRKNKIFKPFAEKLKLNYDKIPDEFDKVFINNKTLKSKLYKNQNNIFFIPNGVDTKHYINYKKTTNDIKNEIDGKIKNNANRKIVGYMGVISDDRVDYELCEYLIKSNPELLFIFAGPILPGFPHEQLINSYTNVKFIGTVYFEQLPYLFSKFNVCIIPHKLSDFIQSMDPKKLYEYLAAGKPIVTTPVSGTENFKDIIKITSDKVMFSKYIINSIHENSDDMIQIRQNIAAQHDWSFRFKEINDIISS